MFQVWNAQPVFEATTLKVSLIIKLIKQLINLINQTKFIHVKEMKYSNNSWFPNFENSQA